MSELLKNNLLIKSFFVYNYRKKKEVAIKLLPIFIID